MAEPSGWTLSTGIGSLVGTATTTDASSALRLERPAFWALTIVGLVTALLVWLGPATLHWAGVLFASIMLGAALYLRAAAPIPQQRFERVVELVVVALLGQAYTFGIGTSFVGVICLLLVPYQIFGRPRHAIVLTIATGVVHTSLAALVTFEVVPNLGMVSFEPYFWGRYTVVSEILMPYGLVLAMGQSFQRRTTEALKELADAGRQVAEREALLREARLDLEQAAGVGQAGRFTGQQIGHFVLDTLLGRGGMGEIYLAKHIDTEEPAAIKLLRRPVGSADNLLGRFEREAQIAAALDSPHVVRVLEIGGADAALPFIAMELLEGQDLSSYLRSSTGNRLSLKEAAVLIADVAKGLSAAHAQGIVHRDIKPSNIFRTKSSRWKVLDFGVARLVGGTGTLTGSHIVGTPGYLSPEQLEGKADARTDVHALGLVVYRALTGRPAFSDPDVTRLYELVLHELPPKPSALAPIPWQVDMVVRIALAKDPSSRFADVQELADAFGAALREEPLSSDVLARAERLGPWE